MELPLAHHSMWLAVAVLVLKLKNDSLHAGFSSVEKLRCHMSELAKSSTTDEVDMYEAMTLFQYSS